MADNDLRAQLEEALAEGARLREENARLRKALAGDGGDSGEAFQDEEDGSSPVGEGSPTEAKIALFRGLFRGREDVFPVLWKTKKGKEGYSPACSLEWIRPHCKKPRVRCAECERRKFRPVTDEVIHRHLTGGHTIGVYPLLEDDTCWFLAADFDKAAWQKDVLAFLETCEEMHVPAVLERSRSGKGGHVWIFFNSLIAAIQARKLGCALLTRTMEKGHQLGLESYDRFFPSQDTLPRGGFGNLIALPLQREPREKGNSLFLDNDFVPHADQWAFLSSLRKMRIEEVDAIVRKAAQTGKIIGVCPVLSEPGEEEDPWTLPPSGERPPEPLAGPFPGQVRMVLANLLYVEKEGLPAALINRLIRLAAFQNPEFYRAQAMRLSTFGKPRVIGCAEDFPKHVGLPRGCLKDALRLFEDHGVKVQLVDERFDGRSITAVFQGTLHALQQEAVERVLPHAEGVLSAATAFGKTVVAAWLIAARGVNTLVLVHRRQLLDQWRERLGTFLDLPPEAIGQVGGGVDRPTGIVDIGILQTLNRKGQVKDMVADYGHIIVDECHHIPAFSFEQVLKQIKARYVMGLTATPIRKDGHHPIIMMQCGPIRFRGSKKEQAALMPFSHMVIPRHTDFRMPVREGGPEPGIQDVYGALVADKDRNEAILRDVLAVVGEKRSPLLLTERTEHLEAIAARLRDLVRNVIVLRGGMGKKQRQEIAEQMKSIGDDEERVLVATGRYIGEGFDDARLDTLFLVMPISWRGTLQQYAGRLHRQHEAKKEVRIYDYVDSRVLMLQRMYDKRLKGYQEMGYSIQATKRVRAVT